MSFWLVIGSTTQVKSPLIVKITDTHWWVYIWRKIGFELQAFECDM